MNLTGALVNFALVQEEQKQIDKAEGTFKKAISSWKEPSTLLSQSNQNLSFSHIARAWYNLARVHVNQGLLSYALKDCSQAYYYDSKSHHKLDLCKTIQLYASLLMEVLSRDIESKVSLHCDSLLHDMIVLLQESEKDCSLSESKEISATLAFLQHQLDLYYSWSNQINHWNSKNFPDLLTLCIECTNEYPFPFPSLLTIIQSLQGKLPSTSITLSIQQSTISLTPQEVQSWLFYIQFNISTKANLFESAISLVQQHPSLASFQTALPYDSFQLLFSSLYNTIQLRKWYSSNESGMEGLDSPLSSSQASDYLMNLQSILPSSQPKVHSLSRKRGMLIHETDKARQRDEEEEMNQPMKKRRIDEEREDKQENRSTRETDISTIRVVLHVVIEGEELVSWEVFSNGIEIDVDSIRSRVNSFIRDSFVSTMILCYYTRDYK